MPRPVWKRKEICPKNQETYNLDFFSSSNNPVREVTPRVYDITLPLAQHSSLRQDLAFSTVMRCHGNGMKVLSRPATMFEVETARGSRMWNGDYERLLQVLQEQPFHAP